MKFFLKLLFSSRSLAILSAVIVLSIAVILSAAKDLLFMSTKFARRSFAALRMTKAGLLPILFFFSCTVNADSAGTTLSQLLGTINTLQANFIQTVVDKSSRQLQQSEGRMTLARPGKFRWQVTKPNAQLIIANGSKLWIYDPDLEQVTIRALSNETGEAPALLLSNTDAALEKKFSIRSDDHSSSLQWFILTPKDRGSMLQAIKLGFANNKIQQMQLQDHLGQTTIIKFSHIVMNTAVSPGLFTFKPPKNVDVINETR